MFPRKGTKGCFPCFWAGPRAEGLSPAGIKCLTVSCSKCWILKLNWPCASEGWSICPGPKLLPGNPVERQGQRWGAEPAVSWAWPSSPAAPWEGHHGQQTWESTSRSHSIARPSSPASLGVWASYSAGKRAGSSHLKVFFILILFILALIFLSIIFSSITWV